MASGGRSGEAARGRVPALDGLRALAVVAVLLFHSRFSWATGGFLGVSAFFTLSGFLITSLLLHDRLGSNRGQLRSFWARRARRLLPAAIVTLFGVTAFAATVATPDQLRVLRGDMFAALGYVANWRFYFSGQSYAELFRAPSPVLHFWSLAIEEQFYVLFPLVVAGTLWLVRGRTELRRRQVLGGLLVIGLAASVIASRVLYASNGSTRVYYGTDTRAAELLVGALLAVIVAGRITPGRPVSRRVRVVANVAGGAALALMLWWWATVAQSTAWLYRGGFAAHALCAAAVIVAARLDGPFSRALSWRPLAALGLISYGVYLYHWPIFLWLTPDRTGLAPAPLFALRIALTLALAIVSFRFLERPILTGSFPSRSPRRRFAPALLAIPATGAALVAALLLVTTSLPAPNIVFAPVSAQPSALATDTPPGTALIRERAEPRSAPKPTPLHRAITLPRPVRVLVVGDSVGQTLGRGLELWALQTGRAEVRNDAVPMCALGRTLEIEAPLGGISAPSEACAGWTTRWPETIASFDPDVVVVQYAVWEIAARRLADGRLERPGDPDIDRWQLAEYQAAADILAARGAPVVWLTSACEDEAFERGEPYWNVDYRTIPALARSHSAVHVFDLNRLLCGGGRAITEFNGVPDIRPDGAHFSDSGALAIAQWLMPIVLGDAPAPARIFPRS